MKLPTRLICVLILVYFSVVAWQGCAEPGSAADNDQETASDTEQENSEDLEQTEVDEREPAGVAYNCEDQGSVQASEACASTFDLAVSTFFSEHAPGIYTGRPTHMRATDEHLSRWMFPYNHVGIQDQIDQQGCRRLPGLPARSPSAPRSPPTR